jgi:hypothetical protein
MLISDTRTATLRYLSYCSLTGAIEADRGGSAPLGRRQSQSFWSINSSVVCRLLSAIYCLLSAVYHLLSAVCCLLSAFCCLFPAACYVPPIGTAWPSPEPELLVLHALIASLLCALLCYLPFCSLCVSLCTNTVTQCVFRVRVCVYQRISTTWPSQELGHQVYTFYFTFSFHISLLSSISSLVPFSCILSLVFCLPSFASYSLLLGRCLLNNVASQVTHYGSFMLPAGYWLLAAKLHVFDWATLL